MTRGVVRRGSLSTDEPAVKAERASANDHDRARRVLGNSVGRRAEQPVADDMSAMAEDDQVVSALFCEAGDEVCGMAGAKLDVDVNAGPVCLGACFSGEVAEEAVLFPLDLFDLADGRRVGG